MDRDIKIGGLGEIEKVVTASIFTLILISKKYSSSINWFDVLEIGATIFIIDFLLVIRDRAILQKLISEGSIVKILGTIVSIIFSIYIIHFRNSLIIDSISKESVEKICRLILLNLISTPLILIAVLFAAHFIAFIFYLCFGKKLTEKFGEKNDRI